MVGGWIGSAIAVLVSPLEGIGNAIGVGFDFVKTNFVNVINKIGTLSSDVGKWLADVSKDTLKIGIDIVGKLGNLGSQIGGFFDALGSSIGNWFDSLVGGVTNLASDIGDWFADLFKSLGSIVAFLNPFDDKFIFKVAFVPSDGFVQNKLTSLKTGLDTRFAFVGQTRDAFNAIRSTVTDSSWQGLKATIPLINKELTIISPVMINEAAGKMKAWIGGFISVLMAIYIVKRGSRVIGAGKG